MTQTPPQDSVSDVERLRVALDEAVSVLERLPYGDWPGAMYSGKVAAANGLIRRCRAALAVPINKIGEDAKEDERLIRAVIRGLLRPPANKRSRRRPLWSAMVVTFAIGSTKAFELCHRLGFDPDREVRA